MRSISTRAKCYKINPLDASQTIVGIYDSDLWGLASESTTSAPAISVTPDVGADPSDPAQSLQTVASAGIRDAQLDELPYGDPGEPGRFPDRTGRGGAAGRTKRTAVQRQFRDRRFHGLDDRHHGNPFRQWAVAGAGQGGGFGMLQTQPQDGSFVAWNGFDGADRWNSRCTRT